MRILVVEDDPKTADYIASGLRSQGHVVDTVADGSAGLVLAATVAFDIVIVDRMLPGLDGLSLVTAARAAGVTAPMLFLTAVGGIDDRVEGLKAGGDDYLTKPFAFSELLARVNALARRPPLSSEPVTLRAADLEMNLISREVTRAGRKISLKPREFRLLEVMLRNRGRVVTRTMLLEQVWDFHFDPKTSVVETLVSRLRAKVDKPFQQALIRTERGLGYRLDEAS